MTHIETVYQNITHARQLLTEALKEADKLFPDSSDIISLQGRLAESEANLRALSDSAYELKFAQR